MTTETKNTLDQLSGLGYNAVGIEYAMAILFGDRIGERGLAHDADVFRDSTTAELAVVIRRIADTIETRTQNIQFKEDGNGSPKKRIGTVATSLRNIAEAMENSNEEEVQDYHWLIIAELILTIASLLDEAGV